MTRLSGDPANRSVLLIGTVIAAALIALALFYVKNQSGRNNTTTNAVKNFNYASLPYSGQDNAKVNVLVVEDFKCPVCKHFEESIEPQLQTNYVDTGKVKQYSLVWPFLAEVVGVTPDDSKLAAQAARCVTEQLGNAGFMNIKAILFRAQGDERTAWATKDRLKELAGNVEGLDQTKFNTCLDTDATLSAVEADKKMAQDAGVTGTPSVFVNGKLVTDAQGQGSYQYEDVSKAIDEALK